MKKGNKNLSLWLLFVIPTLIIFKTWFGFSEISAGDAAFYFIQNLKELTLVPFLWFNNGLGQFSGLLHTFPYLVFLPRALSFLNLPWNIIERIVWYWPFILISIFSSWFFIGTMLPEIKFKFLMPLIYLLNSYILMIIGGGQISIALSYAISPLVIALFMRNIRRTNLILSIISGLILALQLAFEPRIAALTVVVVIFYSFIEFRFAVLKYLQAFLIPLIVVAGVHFYWILPMLLLRREAYSAGLSSSDWLSFLSFAKFENSLSLLHPNWPENIFGKISFMRWEFLIIPIIAYASLLFTGRTRRATNKERITTDNILLFAVLGLLGAFLAKGSNPPLGEVYLWLFKNFPGMSMFRDPTKFYILVALSYSVLIPFSVSQMYTWINSKFKSPAFAKATAGKQKSKVQSKIQNYLAPIVVLVVISYWLFLIRPAWLGQLGGTFKGREVPQEYAELKNFLVSQPEFFRTFWLPQKQRFGFYSNNHPALSANNFVSPTVCQLPLCLLVNQGEKPKEFDPLTTPEIEILAKEREYSLSYLRHPDAPKILGEMGVKYVIVLYDSEGEIFLRDRKYSREEQKTYIAFLDSIPWLRKIDSPDKIAVYETPSYQSHFFIAGESPPALDWKIINPTKYELKIKNATGPFNLVFSETYDEFWQAKIGSEIIPSEKRYNILNSFAIDKKGDFGIVVELTAQKYVWWGLAVSMLTLLISGFSLLKRAKK